MANKRNSRSGTSRSSTSQRMTKAEQEQKAKKEQRKKTARTVAIVLLVILLLAILGFAGFGIAYLVTDGFGGRVPTTVIVIDDEIYSQSAEDIEVYPGDEVRVQNLIGDTQYTMQIVGNASKNNFAFTLDGEPYTWRDMDGEDMTAGFTIIQTETGFTIDYTTVPSILTEALGGEVVISEDAETTGDLFTLIITIGEEEYRFGFGVGSGVTEIILDPDQIVIANKDGALQPDAPADDPVEVPDEPEQPETIAEKEEAMIRYMVQAARAKSYEELEPIMGTIHKLYTDIVSSGESSGSSDLRTALSAYVTLHYAVEDGEYTAEEAAAVREDLGDLMERY